MVDDVKDRVMLPEKKVISKKKVNIFLAVTCKVTRDQNKWLDVDGEPRNLFSFFLCRQAEKFEKHWCEMRKAPSA